MFAGVQQQLDREHNDRVWLAYHTAGWIIRGKRLPRFESLLRRNPSRSKRRQSPDEVLAVVKMINAMHGGTVTDKRKRK